MIHHCMSVHSAWFLREIHTSLSYSGYKNKDHTNAQIQTSKLHLRTDLYLKLDPECMSP